MSSDQVKQIINDILSQIKTKKLDVLSCVDIIVVGMEVVDKLPETTGEEKCKLLLQALNAIEDDTHIIPQNIMDNLNKVNDLNLIKPIIDIIVAASHGNIDINKIEATAFTCFSNFSCFKTK